MASPGCARAVHNTPRARLDIDAGERIIDAQFATSTLYVGKTFLVQQTMFGVNFADGRLLDELVF